MQATEDLFSMIVDPLPLEGAFVSAWRTGGDWSFAGPREACALFHYVEEGSMAIDIGHPNATTPLNQGDLAIFPHGGAHRIGSSTPALSVALEQILPSRRKGGFVRVEIPGADGPALFLCAGLHCGGHASTPLYKLLPELIVIRKHQIEREPVLQGTIDGLLQEVERFHVGSSFALLRGLELIYVLGLRVALEVESATTSMSRALRDPRIANALLYMHTEFKERSTVAGIASSAGMSRSAFSLAFRQATGCAPARYLSKVRVSNAQALMRTTRLSREEIAHRVGYESTVGLYLALRSTRSSLGRHLDDRYQVQDAG
ncbi:AraC family transcriptional regulator [Variovorax ginsengisoli]|uniref:Cupin domain-containing protein n=1 Tax=Variovorax ginsengisoli TaxID=363844 RepID=A0ABT8SDK7_9BURK|nr:cupin domain-containing protein [Variovorax ginsengisoli]MDN8617323.1 cupin domain-containing protein [Variovorax ginsengisoli]MDO1536493.1 cupin domain-containing protein [Variovorax ginsengisoli]